ncbi:hypothetical protein PMAYCL1PPCAC_11553, partial [Pristionchus mayeri]
LLEINSLPHSHSVSGLGMTQTTIIAYRHQHRPKVHQQDEGKVARKHEGIMVAIEGSIDNLSLLISEILDVFLGDCCPLAGNEVEEVVLDISLDDDLIGASHRGAAGELGSEELGSHLQIDIESVESLDHGDALLSSGCPLDGDHSLFLRLLLLLPSRPLPATLLVLLVSISRGFCCSCVVVHHSRTVLLLFSAQGESLEQLRRVSLRPLLASVIHARVLAVLRGHRTLSAVLHGHRVEGIPLQSRRRVLNCCCCHCSRGLLYL